MSSATLLLRLATLALVASATVLIEQVAPPWLRGVLLLGVLGYGWFAMILWRAVDGSAE